MDPKARFTLKMGFGNQTTSLMYTHLLDLVSIRLSCTRTGHSIVLGSVDTGIGVNDFIYTTFVLFVNALDIFSWSGITKEMFIKTLFI